MAGCRESCFALVMHDSKGAPPPQRLPRVIEDRESAMVNRNQGSGTRALIDGLLGGARPPGYAVQPRNHNAVAAAVRQGRADWGVTLDIVARSAGLGFIPIQAERYDFIVPQARADRPAVDAFKALLQEADVRSALQRLGMQP
jgi:putative molybdopterin biosynthesis protein